MSCGTDVAEAGKQEDGEDDVQEHEEDNVVTTDDSLDSIEDPDTESAERLKTILTKEIEIIQKKVIQTVLENNGKEEVVDVDKDKLKETNRNLTRSVESQSEEIKKLKFSFDTLQETTEVKIAELMSANKALAEELRCKDVSLASLRENIDFARQTTEAANKLAEAGKKEVVELKKQLDTLKSEMDIKDLEVKSLSKKLEIEKLTKEVSLLSSQMKRKHHAEGDENALEKAKRMRREDDSGVASGNSSCMWNNEEESYNSDIASIYDPEEEVEEEAEQLLESMKGEVDNIFSHRTSNNNEDEFYVKWKNKSYAEATWESGTLIRSRHKDALDKYLLRMKSSTNPKNYNHAIQHQTEFQPLKEQPSYIGSESLQLKKFQIAGVNFLLQAWHRGHSAILADQEGLGKTVQTIVFLKYLFHNFSFKGPMLVCVSASCLAAWQLEFHTWAPDMNLVQYSGDSESRKIIRTYVCENTDREITFNVLLTDYGLVCKDKSFFQDIVWSNIVLDDGHMMKRGNSSLVNVMKGIEGHHRLLLTASPPDSLEEFFCLLNFLKLEDVHVGGWDEFVESYDTRSSGLINIQSGLVRLRRLIKPVIIRRRFVDLEESLPWFENH